MCRHCHPFIPARLGMTPGKKQLTNIYINCLEKWVSLVKTLTTQFTLHLKRMAYLSFHWSEAKDKILVETPVYNSHCKFWVGHFGRMTYLMIDCRDDTVNYRSDELGTLLPDSRLVIRFYIILSQPVTICLQWG